jgi:hypothetical protein
MKHLKTFENYQSGLPETIWSKILESRDSGWYGEELEGSTECVNLDNGWLADLDQYKDDSQIKSVLDKIEENRFDLWNDDLEDTFECILTEDLYEDDYWENNKKMDGGLKVQYNGWMEDLEELI